MKPPITDFWGKLERDDAGAVSAWHPLVDHCIDVATAFHELIRSSSLRARLGHLAQVPMDDVLLARLSIIAGLHDIGKFNLGFQGRAHTGGMPHAGHVQQGLSIVADRTDHDVADELFSACISEDMWGWAEQDDHLLDLLRASICHHGGPASYASPFEVGLWQARAGLHPAQGLSTLRDTLLAAFPLATQPSDHTLPHQPRFHHAFAGAVMLADWIGSTVNHGGFRYTEPADAPRGVWAASTATEMLARMGWSTRHLARAMDDEASAFALVSEFTPRPAQRALDGYPTAEPNRGSVTVLEAETGSGKTEAALAHFVSLFRMGHVDGMYFALPTRAAATQLHQRVGEAMTRVFGADAPPVVLAVPGYLRVDAMEGRAMAGFEVLWPDKGTRPGRGWAAEHPKRYLAAPIAVGTIDQVLLAGVTASHAHMRSTAVMRSLLVVDEVHASDAYMTQLLRNVLDQHTEAGGHALLLSATLGATARAAYLNQPEPDASEAQAIPYPLVSSRHATPQGVEAPSETSNKTVHLTLDAQQDDAMHVARMAITACRQGARVLVLRNTVAACVATWRAVCEQAPELVMACEGLPTPHHSRYAAEDRRVLDAAVEGVLGKQRGPAAKIVVATQTVEQSLDIDADYLITDLAPVDVLLQRIGRLHRHTPRERPTAFQKAQATILVPDRPFLEHIGRRGLASGSHGYNTKVYADLRILEQTRRLVERASPWVIPAHNRRLVEEATHPEHLKSLHTENPTWVEHQVAVAGQVCADSAMAHLATIAWADPYERAAPAQDAKSISTRLGDGDLMVSLPQGLVSPFHQTLHQLRIPSFLARGCEPPEGTLDVERFDGGFRFVLGGASFQYSHIGLERLESP